MGMSRKTSIPDIPRVVAPHQNELFLAIARALAKPKRVGSRGCRKHVEPRHKTLQREMFCQVHQPDHRWRNAVEALLDLVNERAHHDSPRMRQQID